MIGQKFGRLTIVSAAGKTRQFHPLFRCLCDCGKTVEGVDAYNLKAGKSTSCGCKRGESHGMAYTNTYYVWQAMKARCSNPNNKQWDDYGGRGITVCPEWKNSFLTFASDMGDCPGGYFIDRVDNDKGYSPENCKWVTAMESNSNKRNVTLIEYNGETLPMKTWANKIGLCPDTLKKRIVTKGWDIERAFTEPVKGRPALSF